MLGRKLPIIYAGILLNNAHMLNAGVWGRHDGTENGTGVSFQEYQTHFYVSQTEIDITQSGLIAIVFGHHVITRIYLFITAL